MDATALMKEIFMARNALEACLMSSALLVLVTMMGAGMVAAVGLRDGVSAFVIAAAGERCVDLAENVGAAVIVAADDDAIGEKEVGDGGAFAQEFRVGGDVERVGVGAVAQDDLADPLAGIDRDSALLDDDFVVVDGAGDFAGHRFDVREIGFAPLGGRRADGDKDGRAGARQLRADRQKK